MNNLVCVINIILIISSYMTIMSYCYERSLGPTGPRVKLANVNVSVWVHVQLIRNWLPWKNHHPLHCGDPKVVVIIDVLRKIKWLPP